MYAPYALEVVVRSRLQEEARRAARDQLLRRQGRGGHRRLGSVGRRPRPH
jgi:hypothetical protein